MGAIEGRKDCVFFHQRNPHARNPNVNYGKIRKLGVNKLTSSSRTKTKIQWGDVLDRKGSRAVTAPAASMGRDSSPSPDSEEDTTEKTENVSETPNSAWMKANRPSTVQSFIKSAHERAQQNGEVLSNIFKLTNLKNSSDGEAYMISALKIQSFVRQKFVQFFYGPLLLAIRAFKSYSSMWHRITNPYSALRSKYFVSRTENASEDLESASRLMWRTRSFEILSTMASKANIDQRIQQQVASGAALSLNIKNVFDSSNSLQKLHEQSKVAASNIQKDPSFSPVGRVIESFWRLFSVSGDKDLVVAKRDYLEARKRIQKSLLVSEAFGPDSEVFDKDAHVASDVSSFGYLQSNNFEIKVQENRELLDELDQEACSYEWAQITADNMEYSNTTQQAEFFSYSQFSRWLRTLAFIWYDNFDEDCASPIFGVDNDNQTDNHMMNDSKPALRMAEFLQHLLKATTTVDLWKKNLCARPQWKPMDKIKAGCVAFKWERKQMRLFQQQVLLSQAQSTGWKRAVERRKIRKMSSFIASSSSWKLSNTAGLTTSSTDTVYVLRG